MHFGLLPNWNSIDSVREAHAVLEVMAIVFFIVLAALESTAKILEKQHKHDAAESVEVVGLTFFALAVIAELHAYPYSRRLDTLSERTIVSLSALAETADTKARQALVDSSMAITQSRVAVDDSGHAMVSASSALTVARGARQEADTVNKDVVLAQKELVSVQHGLTLRLDRVTVLVSKRDAFETALKPFAGQRIDVRYAANLQNPNDPYDPETNWFAFELTFSLLQAHWLPNFLRDVPADHGTGVFILVSAGSSKTTQAAAVALGKALIAVPIEVRPAMKGSVLSPESLVSVGPLPPRIPQLAPLYSPLDDETIVVEVAPHP